MIREILMLTILMCLGLLKSYSQPNYDYIDPQAYVCQQIDTGLVQVDGRSAEAVWEKAAWSRSFVDIEGPHMSDPYHDTKVKMLWDDENLYVFSQLAENHLVATLKNHDDIIYRDNDFEIFVDLDGDTHNYCEVEVNLYNTILDLFMAAPYRNGGPLVMDWSCLGIETAVAYEGTLNDPSDEDQGWTVEMSLPWWSLGMRYKPNLPDPGDVIHVNFSRVQWDYEAMDGVYVKKTAADGKRLPEHNWVWSEQGKINMHMPEMWGHVFLATADNQEMPVMEGEDELWLLRQMYYAQRVARGKLGRYAQTLEELGSGPWDEELSPDLGMSVGQDSFEISLHSGSLIYLIDERGHTWKKGETWKKENSSN